MTLFQNFDSDVVNSFLFSNLSEQVEEITSNLNSYYDLKKMTTF